MASGNKPLKKKESIVDPKTLNCMCCNNELSAKEFYDSDSDLYISIGKIPYCKECIEKLYQNYHEKYKNLGYTNPDRKSVERICMALDLYYNDDIFDSVVKQAESGRMSGVPLIYLYVRQIKMYQYRNKDYDTTIHDKYSAAKDKESVMTLYTNDDEYKNETVELSIKIFGKGYEDDEYVYLYEQYCDWTSRHECNTKAQEEVFKNICVTQLQLLKATRSGGDTKDLSTQLQKWLDTGKLQPKQNSGDVVSDAQTFGTLIDKWENTRPIPETEESLRDVDGIRRYTDVFFKGGLAKSLGLNIDYSDEYDEYMSSLTVTKPEYDEDDSGNNALHEAIFGRDIEEDVGGE